MRESLVQAEDKDAQAQDMTDIITKYGTHDWLDRVIDALGPTLLYQAEHVADVLEMIQKYIVAQKVVRLLRQS